MNSENQIVFYLLLIILRPLTVLLHELGHGIPALLFTNQKVTLYIGSYGDTKKGFHLLLGRLEIFFKYNPILWKLGLCVPGYEEISLTKNIIIVLGGPLISLIFGSISIYFSFWSDIDHTIALILFAVAISTFFDFLSNIIPEKKAILLDDGSEAYNDGEQLKQLWKYRNVSDEYNTGVKHYNNQEYNLAAIEFEKVYKKGFRQAIIYKLLISSYFQLKNYSNVLIFNTIYSNKFSKTFDSNDYTNSGLIKSFSGDYNDALEDYNKAIKLDSKNSTAYNNRGYTYNLLEQYELALEDFRQAIVLEKDFAYALNNRGFAKIKLGLHEEGLKDMEKSMSLDGTNSYCYMNYGIYHYDNGAYQLALEYYNKAKELDENTYLLDKHIHQVKTHLSSQGNLHD